MVWKYSGNDCDIVKRVDMDERRKRAKEVWTVSRDEDEMRKNVGCVCR